MKTLAKELDEKVMGLTGEFLKKEAEILVVLEEMWEKRIFPELNYSGVFDYCERRLGLSRAQSYYYKSVIEKSKEVPELKAAVVQGELTLSEARRIAPVITKENKTEWFQKAKSLNQVELERAVKEVNPRAHITERIRPVAIDMRELRARVSAKTEENITRLKDILSQKLGKAATLEEVIAWAVAECRDRYDPERKLLRQRLNSKPKVSLGKHNTPLNNPAAVSSGKRPAPLNRPDTVSSGNRPALPKSTPDISLGKRRPAPAPEGLAGRRPIPSAVKHAVVAAKGFRCWHQSPDGRRCEARRWLHFDHVREVARGGSNTKENLRLLCAAHHRLRHSK